MRSGSPVVIGYPQGGPAGAEGGLVVSWTWWVLRSPRVGESYQFLAEPAPGAPRPGFLGVRDRERDTLREREIVYKRERGIEHLVQREREKGVRVYVCIHQYTQSKIT